MLWMAQAIVMVVDRVVAWAVPGVEADEADEADERDGVLVVSSLHAW